MPENLHSRTRRVIGPNTAAGCHEASAPRLTARSCQQIKSEAVMAPPGTPCRLTCRNGSRECDKLLRFGRPERHEAKIIRWSAVSKSERGDAGTSTATQKLLIRERISSATGAPTGFIGSENTVRFFEVKPSYIQNR